MLRRHVSYLNMAREDDQQRDIFPNCCFVLHRRTGFFLGVVLADAVCAARISQKPLMGLLRRERPRWTLLELG
ncbi:MAG: hypothetical protein JWM39_323 [Parcubacteria group bacterium]|nr:hypothetical protein [Parcubacteria group bacterium]